MKTITVGEVLEALQDQPRSKKILISVFVMESDEIGDWEVFTISEIHTDGEDVIFRGHFSDEQEDAWEEE